MRQAIIASSLLSLVWMAAGAAEVCGSGSQKGDGDGLAQDYHNDEGRGGGSDALMQMQIAQMPLATSYRYGADLLPGDSLWRRQDAGCNACGGDGTANGYCCSAQSCYEDAQEEWHCGIFTTAFVTKTVTSRNTTTIFATPVPSVVVSSVYTTRTSWSTLISGSLLPTPAPSTETMGSPVKRDSAASAEFTITQTTTTTVWQTPDVTLTITSSISSGSPTASTSTTVLETLVIMVTTVPSITPAHASHKSPVGAIVGGIVGGVLGLAIILLAVWALLRRRSRRAGRRLSEASHEHGIETKGLQGPSSPEHSPGPALERMSSSNELLMFPQPPSTPNARAIPVMAEPAASPQAEPANNAEKNLRPPSAVSSASSSHISPISPTGSQASSIVNPSGYPASPVSPVDGSRFSFSALRTNSPFTIREDGAFGLSAIPEAQSPSQTQFRVPRKPVPARTPTQ